MNSIGISIINNNYWLTLSSQFLLPGLVDTHIHAPQYVNSGVGYDKMLMDWLDAYTFPAEAEFQKIEVAKDVYPKVVVSQSTYDNCCAHTCVYCIYYC